jgi:hypothetical protein
MRSPKYEIFLISRNDGPSENLNAPNPVDIDLSNMIENLKISSSKGIFRNFDVEGRILGGSPSGQLTSRHRVQNASMEIQGIANEEAAAETVPAEIMRMHFPLYRFHPSVLINLPNSSDSFDISVNMKLMDKLYNASFYEYIKGEENVLMIARNLLIMIQEFPLIKVATALRWVINGWKLESVAKLLRLITQDWNSTECGTLINLICIGWEVLEDRNKSDGRACRITYPSTSISCFEKLNDHTDVLQSSRTTINALMKLVAIMIAGEMPDVAALFLFHLTQTDNWGNDRVTEMISFLDAVLDWDENYFKRFTQEYVEASGRKCKLSFEYLAALYKSNLALQNYKVAIADYQIALASRNAQLLRSEQNIQVPEDNTNNSNLSPVLSHTFSNCTDSEDLQISQIQMETEILENRLNEFLQDIGLQMIDNPLTESSDSNNNISSPMDEEEIHIMETFATDCPEDPPTIIIGPGRTELFNELYVWSTGNFWNDNFENNE